MIDVKSLTDLELKKLATRSGPKQHLALDELARRIRDQPSSWSPEKGPWAWDPIDITRAPNAIEAEGAFLKWSHKLNDGTNPKLKQEQEARLDELKSHLDQDPDSLETKYFNAIGLVIGTEEYFENQATGVELEDEVSPQPDDPEPWDPEKIRVNTKHYSLRQMVDMIADGDIDLAPDFQRHDVWKHKQRWGLIESLLLGIPLPSFYFNENTSGRLQVVDGVQRLTTIFRYVNNKDFKLGDVIYLHDLKNQGFDDLAPMFRRRLNNAQFVAHVIDPQTPYRVKFDIFRRINTGGSPLSAQEIRHCMSGARSRQFLKELATDESFSTATGNALRNHPRMADREVALRFVGFRLFTPDDYAQHGSFDEFLGDVTKQLDDPAGQSLDELRADFVRGMINCYTVFGDYAFRKWSWDAERRNPINRALFESWGTVLADHDETTVRAGKEELVKRAREMMTNNYEFIRAISGSTGDVRNVRTRILSVRDAAQEVLG